MTTLDRLLNPTQRQRLSEAIPARVSCRAYAGDPSPADWASLAYAVGRYRLPGARLALLHVEEALFTGTMLGVGRITNCRAVAAVIASGEPFSRLSAGALGELFVLEATSLGLGTCWVAGTYRRRLLTVPLEAGETVVSVIAVGQPTPGAMNPAGRKRKPLERILHGDLERWSPPLRAAAEAVRSAPSALNLQPWQLALEGQTFILDGSDRFQLDLGIALCHAELTLPPHSPWRFAQRRSDPLCRTELL